MERRDRVQCRGCGEVFVVRYDARPGDEALEWVDVRRILVVDDEDGVRVLLCRILTAKGYAVTSARDGSQALKEITRGRPGLVILDLMMPVMDGWTVLARLREMADPPPVLVLSACDDRKRVLEAGAAACLGKPFSLGRLVDACERLLSRDRERKRGEARG